MKSGPLFWGKNKRSHFKNRPPLNKRLEGIIVPLCTLITCARSDLSGPSCTPCFDEGSKSVELITESMLVVNKGQSCKYAIWFHYVELTAKWESFSWLNNIVMCGKRQQGQNKKNQKAAEGNSTGWMEKVLCIQFDCYFTQWWVNKCCPSIWSWIVVTGDKAAHLSKSNLTALLSVLLHNKSGPTECVPPENAARVAEWGIVRPRPPDCIHRRPPQPRGEHSWWGIAMADISLSWACETQENLQGTQAGVQYLPILSV